MSNVKYEYIDYKNTFFDEVINLRYDILFRPYGKISKYKYDDLDKDSFHLIGIINNKTISYSRLSLIDINNKIGKISNVVVHPDYNNMGIGRDMLKRHIITAKENKFKEIYLHARVDTIEFYEKAGFISEGSAFISDRSGLQLQKMYIRLA